MSALLDKHRKTLDGALNAISTREFWSPYPEVPSGKIYGETAKADGEKAFQSYLGNTFEITSHPSNGSNVGAESSPFGMEMNISYPGVDVEEIMKASRGALAQWKNVSANQRTGICLEILDRLNKHSFEIGNAVMHTTGQAFIMAFQAGGPHAQDRGLEAVAYAYREVTRTPENAMWVKPVSKDDAIKMEKNYRVIPRGVSLTIGCATFPTWNTYPGLFASLVTGNTVVVKPHPTAILPLAISVAIAREVLSEEGIDPNVVLLAADTPSAPITKELVTHPDTAIIDFTGSNAFGTWVRDNAGANTQVYTEEAGVNSIAITSSSNFKAMCSNIAFSLSLYSGQMCTSPQGIFVPRNGIETDQGHKTFDEVCEGIVSAVDKLLSDPARAGGVCGAITNPDTLTRIEKAASDGSVIRASSSIEGMDGARTATPLIVKLDAKESDAFREERFGPISYVIAVDDGSAAIHTAASLAKQKGAITAALYSTDEQEQDMAVDAFCDAGVNLSINLFGGIFVNQSAAFSDFHVTGANPAGNATLTDAAYVANRFRTVTVRRLVD